jgi:uncharacterized membrane protein (TIGR02234 family)
VTGSRRLVDAGKREFGIAVLLVAIGSAVILLSDGRPWHTIHVEREAPLGPITVHVTANTLTPSLTALALVGLAGTVALLATRGWPRRIVGGLLLVDGIALAALAVLGAAAPSHRRAISLVSAARLGAVLDAGARVDIATALAWPALDVLGAILLVFGAALVAWRGNRWTSMSARYDRPVGMKESVDPSPFEQDRAHADLALWQSIDRGEDPTTGSDS